MKQNVEYGCGIYRTEKEEFTFTLSDFENRDTFADCSLRKKEYEKSIFASLPFSNTVEAEAFGAEVIFQGKDQTPRIKNFICKTLDEILLLQTIYYQGGRIKEILLACGILKKKGQCVLYELSGPFTILSGLIDLGVVFRSVRKDRETFFKVYQKLEEESLVFIRLLLKEEIKVISFADPAVSEDVIGKKDAERIIKEFTYPFLKKMNEEVKKKALIVLCPKITRLLLDMKLAQCKEVPCEEGLTYAEGCKRMIGQAEFIGSMCIHNEKMQWKDQRIRTISLL